MPRIRVRDIEIHYVTMGEGDPVVLIMGLSGDHLAWGFQLPAFAERHRVIAFDNRGAGQTEAPPGPYTIRGMAEDTVGLLDQLGIDRAHVVGASMGGMIAQELALHHPRRVRTLQLHCSLARPDPYVRALLSVWRTVRTALDVEQGARAIAVWLFSAESFNERPEFVEQILQTGLANPYPQSLAGFLAQADAVAGHDTLDRLGAIRCPTLITVGEDDILAPRRFSTELAARIPGARLNVIPRAGHVHFWEAAETFNRICLDFLSAAGQAQAIPARNPA